MPVRYFFSRNEEIRKGQAERVMFSYGEEKSKILNDIGFCLENARFMYKFSWQVGFYIPY